MAALPEQCDVEQVLKLIPELKKPQRRSLDLRPAYRVGKCLLSMARNGNVDRLPEGEQQRLGRASRTVKVRLKAEITPPIIKEDLARVGKDLLNIGQLKPANLSMVEAYCRVFAQAQ